MWKKDLRNYDDRRPIPYKGKIAWEIIKPNGLWKKMESNKKLSSSTSYPNMAGRVKCGVTEDMLDLLDEEAKWWVTNYPLQASITEHGKIALNKFGAKYSKNKAEILKSYCDGR